MASADSIKALVKLLIGVAWEDQQVSPQEMELLKDIIFRLPDISAEDWHALEIYWITPIRRPELQRLSYDFLSTLKSGEARAKAKAVLEAIVLADQSISPQEKIALQEAAAGIDRQSQTVVTDISRLVAAALPKRADELSIAGALQEKRVLSRLRNHYGNQWESAHGLTEEEMSKLALSGALMGRVAYADANISEKEMQSIREVAAHQWGLYELHAEILAHFAMDAARNRVDVHRLARGFFELSTPAERLDFLDILFAVAKSQDHISREELGEVAEIAAALKIRQADFEGLYRAAAR
jgi:uncharacterized tellurite resistance protein B-like protein